MTQRFSTLALVLVAAIGLTASAPAAPKVEVVPVKLGARLLVGGKLIALFRTPNGSLTAEGRAEYAARRLRELVADDLSAMDISVRDRGDSWGVYANGGLVMIATQDEAKERNTTPEAVARMWAANLKSALGSGSGATAKKSDRAPARPAKAPRLALSDQSVAVPVDETRRVSLSGTATGPVTLATEGDECATVELDGSTGEIVVFGKAPGKLTVRVSRGGASAEFTVWVKKYAGRLGETPVAEVTGDLTPGSLVKQVAQACYLKGIEREPGTIVKLLGAPTGVRALPRGEIAEIGFPVLVTGDGYLPLKTTARVTVRNRPLTPAETRVLLYSNDPESIREFGTLYQGLVTNAGPVRLMFHHQNRSGRTITFQVHLLNPHDTPAEVQVIQAEAGPVIDTIQVGHRAGERYLSASKSDVGYILQVPAKSVRTVYTTAMPQLRTVSGIYGFRVLSGGSLVTEVTSSAEPTKPPITPDILTTAQSEPHTYPNPQKDLKYRYVVGEPWTFVPIGRQAISGTRANRKLFGNYGVLYNITVEVSNPTNSMQTVRVVMAPEAGWARGAFFIEGQLIEAPQVAPPAEATLYSTKLGPGERRTLRIQGIPVGGSAYPVSLVVRS